MLLQSLLGGVSALTLDAPEEENTRLKQRRFTVTCRRGRAEPTCRRWSPCVRSAVDRSSGSTGGLPVRRARGTLCCRGGSGRSAAPGESGCAPGTDPASGKSASRTSAHTYKPAGRKTSFIPVTVSDNTSIRFSSDDSKPGFRGARAHLLPFVLRQVGLELEVGLELAGAELALVGAVDDHDLLGLALAGLMVSVLHRLRPPPASLRIGPSLGRVLVQVPGGICV